MIDFWYPKSNSESPRYTVHIIDSEKDKLTQVSGEYGVFIVPFGMPSYRTILYYIIYYVILCYTIYILLYYAILYYVIFCTFLLENEAHIAKS